MAYDAFISYSSAADGRLAPALHTALERFAKPWFKTRACRVFHDNTGLSVTEALWPKLQEVIRGSRHFVLLASPGAAASEWVRREVAERVQQCQPVLLALTAGEIVWSDADGDFDWEQTDALPDNLKRHFAYEPLYVDLRWAKTRNDLTLRHPRFHAAIATLASRIRGIDKDELSSIAVVQHRRTMTLAWSALALLAVLLATAITQTILAVRARDLAERRLEDAISVAQEIIFNVENKLSTVAGGAAVRRNLLASSRRLIERLQGEAQPGSAAGVRMTRAEVAAFQAEGNLARTNGRLDEAERKFEAAFEGARRLLQSDAPEAVHWQDLVHAAWSLASLYREQGRYGEAREKLEQATSAINYLVDQKHEISRFRADLASVHVQWFHLERVTGNVAAAKDHGLKALALQEELVTLFPENLEYRERPAGTNNLLGELLVENASPAEGREHYAKALSIRQELWKDDRENADMTFALASSYSRVGQASLAMGDLEHARKELTLGLEFATALANTESDNSEYVAMQAMLHGELGQLESTAGNIEIARRELQRNCELTDRLAEREPKSFSAASARVYAYLHIGALEFENARHDVAGRHYAVALRHAKSLLQANGDNLEAKRIAALAHAKTGNVALATRRFELATRSFAEYLALSEALADADARNAQYKIDLTQAHSHLAELAFAQRDGAETLRHFEAGLKLARSIVDETASLQLRRNLWSQLLGLCKARFVLDDVGGARELCREAADLTSALLRGNPQNPQLVAMHKQSLEYLGVVSEPIKRTGTKVPTP